MERRDPTVSQVLSKSIFIIIQNFNFDLSFERDFEILYVQFFRVFFILNFPLARNLSQTTCDRYVDGVRHDNGIFGINQSELIFANRSLVE